MYQALLTRTYLTTKVMPLLAAAAVMLCTAMVLIVWSVMGGFLVKLLESGNRNNGDVSITWPYQGFAYYQDLIASLEQDAEFVSAATPVVETLAMVSLPDNRLDVAQVRGVDPASYARVVSYADVLHWRPLTEAVPKDREGRDPRLLPSWRARLTQALADGLAMSKTDPKTGRPVPAVVPGIEMSGLYKRQPGGWYDFRSIGIARPDGSVQYVSGLMADRTLTIRLLPLDARGRSVDMASITLPVANEFRTGVFDADKRTLLMPLDTLQRELKMDAARLTTSDPYDPAPLVAGEGASPARVTSVIVRAAAGKTAEDLLPRVQEAYRRFAERHFAQVPSAAALIENNLIQTWKMSQARIIGAVEKETGLVLIILSFISFTSSFLILAIFWAMVSEKTKDVGVLRALGASRGGIAWVWLRYGLLIGVIGSILGGLLAWLIVSNINEIHDWMGERLGLVVWDPSVYYFSEIPRTIRPLHAVIVLASGVLTSLLGALIPAWRAAAMDPVRALRFE